MKKIVKSKIFIFVLGFAAAIFVTGIVYALSSNDIGYNGTTVKGALDDLYDRVEHNETYTPTTRSSQLDMGISHKYRYVDTTSIPNINTETYTPTTRSSQLDMGLSNKYRYVDTTSIPNTNTGTYTANGTMSLLDMGAENTYRYVQLNAIPNINFTGVTYSAHTDHASHTFSATPGYYYIVAVEQSSSRAATCSFSGATQIRQVNTGWFTLALIRATSSSVTVYSSNAMWTDAIYRIY